jgi:hypothetical protein
VRVLSLSLWRGPDSFLCSAWNLLDAALVVAGFVYYGTESPAVGVFMSLRPLRIVARVDSLKKLVVTLVKSLAGLATLSSLIFVAWFSYALVGMQVFKGGFYSCVDWDGQPLLAGGEPLSGCQGAGGVVQNAPFHFDSIISSMVAVFVLCTCGGWGPIYWSAMDMTGPGLQPKAYNSPMAFSFFFFGLALFGLYLMQLFLGVVFETFLVEKAKGADGLLMSSDERRWSEYQQRLEKVVPDVVCPYPEWPPRRLCYRIAYHPVFETFIIAMLCLNFLALGSEHLGQPAWLTRAQDVSSLIFSAIFGLEMLIKLGAMGLGGYSRQGKNCFDGFVTVVGLCDSAMFLFGACGGVDSAAIKLIRSLRVFRILRLVLYLPNIDIIVESIAYPLPALCRVFLLLSIGLFMFASLGIALFDGVEVGTRYMNFSGSLYGAMQLLFVTSTGDAWTDTLEALQAGRGSLGTIYMIVFVFLFLFLLSNLFVMALVETYDMMTSEGRDIAEKLIPVYKQTWARQDPEGHGFITRAQLFSLVRELPKPLGVGPEASLKTAGALVYFLESQACFEYRFSDVLLGLSVVMFMRGGGMEADPSAREVCETLAALTIQAYARRHLDHRRASLENDYDTAQCSRPGSIVSIASVTSAGAAASAAEGMVAGFLRRLQAVMIMDDSNDTSVDHSSP